MYQIIFNTLDIHGMVIYHDRVIKIKRGNEMAKIITTTINIEDKAKLIKSLEAKIAELQELKEEKVTAIKEVMENNNLTELQAGVFTIRLADVVRNNFNTSAFKKKYLELYNAFIKQSTYKKFSIV